MDDSLERMVSCTDIYFFEPIAITIYSATRAEPESEYRNRTP